MIFYIFFSVCDSFYLSAFHSVIEAVKNIKLPLSVLIKFRLTFLKQIFIFIENSKVYKWKDNFQECLTIVG